MRKWTEQGGAKAKRGYPAPGGANEQTVRKVNMTHHATFRINRSNHCRDMAVCRFFKMAPVRHVGFLKFRNCNCRTLRSVNVRYRVKFRADRSSRFRDMAVYSIFKMAAIRHLGFLKVGNFNCPYPSGGQSASPYRILCISVKPL